MSIHAPSSVAPPRPVAGAAVGPAVASSVRTTWAGMPALPTTKAVDAVPATARTCALTSAPPFASGAGDRDGVAAGRHREVAGGVAESDVRDHGLAVHADVGLADLRRDVNRPEGGLAGLDAAVAVHEQVDVLAVADGDDRVLSGAEPDGLADQG